MGSETTGTLPGAGSVGVAGDYRYTLPIEVPPGRAGMAPALSLSYSSSGENGIAGVGWGLVGLSSIKRCNTTFATDGAAKEEEAWCLDGQRLVASGEALVDVPGRPMKVYGHTLSVWRTESDTFARIEMEEVHHEGFLLVTVVSARVLSRDGRIRTYAPQSGENSELLLATEEDRFGNTITYEHKRQDPTPKTDVIHPAPLAIGEETTLLVKILYTGRISSGELGARQIELTYEDRPDPIFATDSIPASSSKKRLKTIESATRPRRPRRPVLSRTRGRGPTRWATR